MRTQVSYLDLAKEAKSRGDRAGVWRAFKNHARVKRKERRLREQSDAQAHNR